MVVVLVNVSLASEPLAAQRNFCLKNAVWILPSDVPARHQAPQGARNAVADGPAHGLVGAAPAALRAARVRRRLGELGRLKHKNQTTTPNSLSGLIFLVEIFIIYIVERQQSDALPSISFLYLYDLEFALDSWFSFSFLSSTNKCITRFLLWALPKLYIIHSHALQLSRHILYFSPPI